MGEFNLLETAREYFEECSDAEATKMLIFMRDKCPMLWEMFLIEWGAVNEQKLLDFKASKWDEGLDREVDR